MHTMPTRNIPETPEIGTPHYNGQILGPKGVRYRGVPLYINMHELCTYKHTTTHVYMLYTNTQTHKNMHKYTITDAYHTCIMKIFCKVQIFTILAIKIQHTKIWTPQICSYKHPVTWTSCIATLLYHSFQLVPVLPSTRDFYWLPSVPQPLRLLNK